MTLTSGVKISLENLIETQDRANSWLWQGLCEGRLWSLGFFSDNVNVPQGEGVASTLGQQQLDGPPSTPSLALGFIKFNFVCLGYSFIFGHIEEPNFTPIKKKCQYSIVWKHTLIISSCRNKQCCKAWACSYFFKYLWEYIGNIHSYSAIAGSRSIPIWDFDGYCHVLSLRASQLGMRMANPVC